MDEERGVPDLGMWAVIWGWVAGLLRPALAGSQIPRVLAVFAGWAAAFCCAVLVFYLNCVLATELTAGM